MTARQEGCCLATASTQALHRRGETFNTMVSVCSPEDPEPLPVLPLPGLGQGQEDLGVPGGTAGGHEGPGRRDTRVRSLQEGLGRE